MNQCLLHGAGVRPAYLVGRCIERVIVSRHLYSTEAPSDPLDVWLIDSDEVATHITTGSDWCLIVETSALYEGYDNYAMKSFREYLIRKYVEGEGWKYDDERWTQKFGIRLDDEAICPDGTMKSFEYREYLKTNDFAKIPQAPENPLAAEWGTALHITSLNPYESYSTERNDKAWKYMSDRIREHAEKSGKKVYITANGNNRYVDFQTNALWEEWVLKDGRMDGSISLIMKWKSMIDTGRMLGGEGIPVVFFHDWGPTGIPFKELSTEDKINWIRIYGAEIYAAGGFFAFPVSGPPGDSSKEGFLGEIIRQADFFYKYGELFRNIFDTKTFGTGVKVSIPNVTVTVAEQKQPGRKIWY